MQMQGVRQVGKSRRKKAMEIMKMRSKDMNRRGIAIILGRSNKERRKERTGRGAVAGGGGAGGRREDGARKREGDGQVYR